MKNAVIYYAVVALGVVALAIGVYYFLNPPHAIRAYTALGVGVVSHTVSRLRAAKGLSR